MSHPNCPTNTFRKYMSSQSISRIIRHLPNLSFIFELDNNSYRSENLFFDDLHIRMDVSEYGRFDKESFISMMFTTMVDRCTCCFSGINVTHDTLMWLNQDTLHRK